MKRIKRFFQRNTLAGISYGGTLILMGIINHGARLSGLLAEMIAETLVLAFLGMLTNEWMRQVERWKLFNKPNERAGRLLLQYLLVLAGAMLIVSLLYILPMLQLLVTDGLNEQLYIRLRQVYIVIWIVTSLLFAIRKGMQAYLQLRENQLQQERLRKEQQVEQFEALKNQVNPHFLFNCLSVLGVLIQKDRMEAGKFVDELSAVYRYILDTRGRQLVPLKEELKFLHAYAYLLQQRYKSSLQIELPATASWQNRYVNPLLSQLLLEHALQYQRMTRDEPLRLRFSLDHDFLVLSHRLQLKELPNEPLQLSDLLEKLQAMSPYPMAFQLIGEDLQMKIPIFTDL